MTDYRIFTGPGAPWPPASAPPPPAASAAFANPIVLATELLLSAYAWYKGPSYWRADSSAPAGPQKFALLQVNAAITGPNPPFVLVPGTVTSGALTAGQWNDVLLGAPIQLAPGVPYMISTGLVGNFNFVANFWTSGGGSAGLVNGPLKFPGSGGDQFGNPQSSFNTGGGSDPTVTVPDIGNNGFDAGIDAIISDVVPVGAGYRILAPGLLPGVIFGVVLTGNDAATISMEVDAARPVQVKNLWHYSAPGNTALPDSCAIYNTATHNPVFTVSPATWSGAAGAGWITCTNLPAGVILPAGNYLVAVHQGTAGSNWFNALSGFWTTHLGSTGVLVNGPISAPTRAASSNQGAFDNLTPGVISYPTQFSDEGYWLDLEVIPAASTASALLASWP